MNGFGPWAFAFARSRGLVWSSAARERLHSLVPGRVHLRARLRPVPRGDGSGPRPRSGHRVSDHRQCLDGRPVRPLRSAPQPAGSSPRPAASTTTITPHLRRSSPAARSSKRPVTWSASSRTCSATAAAEGSAPRGNPILVPLDVSRRGHRRSCIEKGDWVAYPVDLQGKRLFGRKVALVSVGANDIRQPLARRLVTAAARLAYYRSFRDTFSRDAMARMLSSPILHSLFRHLVMSQL